MSTVLVVSLGVLFQSRFRGGSSPQEVATRYLAAARSGDRVALFLLSHPDAVISRTALDIRIEKYRTVPPGSVAITYKPHPDAAYFMTVIMSANGTVFDHVDLEYDANRWYIVNLKE